MAAKIALSAISRQDVLSALTDASSRHALIACWISADPDKTSWVSYLTHQGSIALLTFTPDGTLS